LLDENKINPHATNEFGWNEIAEAHDGLEKSKFVGKVFINLTK
jgi:NADPH:quinone reductase-like Zn-dependent oxidoreductase